MVLGPFLMTKKLKAHYRGEHIIALFDQGKTVAEIAASTGIGRRQVRHVIEREKLRREGAEAVKEQVTPEMLPEPQRGKLAKAIRQEKEKMARRFRISVFQAVEIELDARLKKISDRYRAEQALAKRVMEARRGFLSRKIYKLILSCLHPDRVTDPKLKARYEEAFREFTKLEKLVLDEKESPTHFVGIPSTRAEWDQMRKKPIRTPAQGLEVAL